MIAVTDNFLTAKGKRLSVFFAFFLLTFGHALIARCADNNAPNPLDAERILNLRKTLGRSCSISFKNGNLRNIVESLEKEYSIPIWLDPNIDLDVQSEFISSGDILASSLDGLAASRNAIPIWIGDTIYFAPKESAGALESAYWRLYRSWPKARRKADKFEWTIVSTPRDLLEAWSKKNKWKLDGMDVVEHDIWMAGSIPAGQAPDQLACLLIGLKLEAVVDASNSVLKLVPIGKEDSFPYAYSPERIEEKRKVDWKKHWPKATMKASGKLQVVNATPASHRELVAFPLIPKLPKNNSGDPLANITSSFKHKGRVITVLAAFAEKNKLTYDPWPLPMNVQDRPVDIDFNKATIDAILTELGEQAYLGFTRNGLNVKIEIRGN